MYGGGGAFVLFVDTTLKLLFYWGGVGGGDEPLPAKVSKCNAMLTVLYLVIPRKIETNFMGRVRVSTYSTGSLWVFSTTQESGDAPKVSPLSETTLIVLIQPGWGHFAVGRRGGVASVLFLKTLCEQIIITACCT